MNSKKLFVLNKIVKLVNYLAMMGFVAYIFSMVVIPISKGDWNYIQEVWDRWQTFNAGMLAFIAAVITFNIASFNSEQLRSRKFKVAKAALPATLSDFYQYFKSSANILKKVWYARNDDSHTDKEKNVIDDELPKIPEYKDSINSAIENADDNVSKYLSNYLIKLQIFHARLRQTLESIKPDSGIFHLSLNTVEYIYNLAELYAMTSRLIEFAREDQPLNDSKLSWNDFKNAYSLLEFDEICDDSELELITKNRIEK